MPADLEHVFLDKQHPGVWRALNGLGLKAREAAEAVGLGEKVIELLNVRISQLNGCAYCLDVHVEKALKAGESSQRLAVLSAWRDTGLFSPKERAVLELAESVTELPDYQSRQHQEASSREHLTDEEYSAVTWLAITINAFNRVSITSHHPVSTEK